MIWNSIKQFFWCGVFHETKLSMDPQFDWPPQETDIGGTAYCIHCWTYFEVI